MKNEHRESLLTILGPVLSARSRAIRRAAPSKGVLGLAGFLVQIGAWIGADAISLPESCACSEEDTELPEASMFCSGFGQDSFVNATAKVRCSCMTGNGGHAVCTISIVVILVVISGVEGTRPSCFIY